MRRGLATEVVGFFLLLAAGLLGSVALFSFALGLLVTVAGCFAVTSIAARRVAISRTVDRTEVVEGNPVDLRFGVRGLGALPVQVEAREEDGSWRALADSSSRTRTIERPGAHLIGPSEVRVRDGLRLFSRYLTAGEPTVILVLPEPANVPAPPRPAGHDPGGDPEPDGLQPYTRGTPVGRIHWPSVARAGEWQERRVVVAPRGMPLVVVDLSGVPSEEAIAWTQRAAAGQIRGLARAGGCRVLLPGERLPIAVENASEGWPAMHRRLAGLRGGAATAPAAAGASALHVRADQAPALARSRSSALPPDVVPLEKSTFGHVPGRRST